MYQEVIPTVFSEHDIAVLDRAINKVLSTRSSNIQGAYRELPIVDLMKVTKPLLDWQAFSTEDKKIHFNKALEDLNTLIKGIYSIGFAEWAFRTQDEEETFILATRRSGFDVNELLPSGETLLGEVARSGKIDLVKYLLGYTGIDINKRGEREDRHPLILAIERKHTAIALLLLSDQRIAIPASALKTAVCCKEKEVVNHLISLPGTQLDKNVIDRAIGYNDNNQPILKILFAHPSASLLSEEDLDFCIGRALSLSNPGALQILLAHEKSNPNKRFGSVNTLCWCAIYYRTKEIDVLLSYPKIDLTAKSSIEYAGTTAYEMTTLEYVQSQEKELEKRLAQGQGERRSYRKSLIEIDKTRLKKMKYIESRMIHAHTQQFYREALFADPKEKDSIIKKHEEAKLTPHALCEYMFSKIMERLETEEDPDIKFQILLGEKQQIFEDINQPTPKSALIGFILPEKTKLLEKIDAQLKIINEQRGVSASPTSETYRPSSNISINECRDDTASAESKQKSSVFSNPFKK